MNAIRLNAVQLSGKKGISSQSDSLYDIKIVTTHTLPAEEERKNVKERKTEKRKGRHRQTDSGNYVLDLFCCCRDSGKRAIQKMSPPICITPGESSEDNGWNDFWIRLIRMDCDVNTFVGLLD